MGLGLLGLFSASVIGVGVGIALQRGRGCTNTAFRNLILARNGELALMLVVVVAIEIIGYYLLSLEILPNFVFNENPIPLSYLWVPLGGFMFGLGTVFAGGCAGGTCYRIGEGSVASLLSFAGFSFGIFLIGISFNTYVETIRTDTTITINNEAPSLTHLFPRWVWTVLAVILLVSTIFYYMNKQRHNNTKLTHLRSYWTPINTGIIVGGLGVLARYYSTRSGREFGLSTTDGIANIFESILFISPISWIGIFILGLILGSAVSALQGGEFKISVPHGEEILRFFGGGTLLGMGAMLGLGCNFGHIFGGMPELGISSFISVIFMVMGNWSGSILFYTNLGRELPLSTPQ